MFFKGCFHRLTETWLQLEDHVSMNESTLWLFKCSSNHRQRRGTFVSSTWPLFWTTDVLKHTSCLSNWSFYKHWAWNKNQLKTSCSCHYFFIKCPSWSHSQWFSLTSVVLDDQRQEAGCNWFNQHLQMWVCVGKQREFDSELSHQLIKKNIVRLRLVQQKRINPILPHRKRLYSYTIGPLGPLQDSFVLQQAYIHK